MEELKVHEDVGGVLPRFLEQCRQSYYHEMDIVVWLSVKEIRL